VIAVHQLVPSMVANDATANHTLEVQRALRHAGFDSEIYALAVHPALERRVRLVHELPRSSAAAYLLYQFSSVSPLADLLLSRREQLALNFHNVTPPGFFTRWERGIHQALQAARVQLDQLARLQPLGVCDSTVNAEELARHGIERRVVAPVLVDLRPFREARGARLAAGSALADSGPRWLFVGTVAPHKAQHELVQALACHRRTYGPGARLVLVGRVISPAYGTALRRYIAALGLTDAVELVGEVDADQLLAQYQTADVFVTMSRHEGFCVPVLEAMASGLPVVARAAGAVGDTVAAGGLVLDGGAGPSAVAAAVERVWRDGRLRAALTAAGQHRAESMALARTAAIMVDVVRRWTGGQLDELDGHDDRAPMGASVGRRP